MGDQVNDYRKGTHVSKDEDQDGDDDDGKECCETKSEIRGLLITRFTLSVLSQLLSSAATEQFDRKFYLPRHASQAANP